MKPVGCRQCGWIRDRIECQTEARQSVEYQCLTLGFLLIFCVLRRRCIHDDLKSLQRTGMRLPCVLCTNVKGGVRNLLIAVKLTELCVYAIAEKDIVMRKRQTTRSGRKGIDIG